MYVLDVTGGSFELGLKKLILSAIARGPQTDIFRRMEI